MKIHAEIHSEKSPLSKKENQILGLLAEGLSRDQMAEHLHRSFSTVCTHVLHIFQKLDADNSNQAISIAVLKGILSFQKHLCLVLAVIAGIGAVLPGDAYADTQEDDTQIEQPLLRVRVGSGGVRVRTSRKREG